MFKHSSILMYGDKMVQGTRENNGEAAVLIVPSLPTKRSSRVTFRINNPHCTYLGVCFRNVVEYQGFLIESSYRIAFRYLGWRNTGHGTCLLRENGQTFSYFNFEDNDKQRSWGFEKDDIVTVELDPLTGKLTFSKAAHPPLVLETGISSRNMQPVHFCALIGRNDSSISLV